MEIHISLNDGVPIYQQIVTQVRYLVAAGTLKPGMELPTIRALAEQVQVNPNTVARAYRELEQEGTVEKRSTKGTFVAEAVPRLTARHRESAIAERIDQMLAEATQLGLSLDRVMEILRSRARQMGLKDSTRKNSARTSKKKSNSPSRN